MYDQYFNNRREELHKKNIIIRQNQIRINERNKPILDEIHQENKDQIQQQELPSTSQVYKINSHDPYQSDLVKSQLQDVNNVIQDHYKRAKVLQDQYLISEEMNILKHDENLNVKYKLNQQKLTQRFNVVVKQLEKQQTTKISKPNNMKIHQPVMISKKNLEQQKNIKEGKKLNEFVRKMTDKYSQYLDQANQQQMNDQNKKVLELYEEQFINFEIDKDVNKKHQYAMTQKEKPQFDRVLTSKTFAQRMDSRSIVPLTISHYPIDVSQQLSKIKLQQIQELYEAELIKKAENNILFTILYERQQMDFSSLKKNKLKIANLIWLQMNSKNLTLVSKQDISNFFSTHMIFFQILNLNQTKFRDLLIKFKTKQQSSLSVKDFVRMLQSENINLSEMEIMNEIKNKIEIQAEAPLLEKFNEILVRPKSSIELVEPQQRQQDINFQQLDQLEQINQHYHQINHPLPQKHKFPEDRKIVLLLSPPTKQTMDPAFLKFAKQVNIVTKYYHKGEMRAQTSEKQQQ